MRNLISRIGHCRAKRNYRKRNIYRAGTVVPATVTIPTASPTLAGAPRCFVRSERSRPRTRNCTRKLYAPAGHLVGRSNAISTEVSRVSGWVGVRGGPIAPPVNRTRHFPTGRRTSPAGWRYLLWRLTPIVRPQLSRPNHAATFTERTGTFTDALLRLNASNISRGVRFCDAALHLRRASDAQEIEKKDTARWGSQLKPLKCNTLSPKLPGEAPCIFRREQYHTRCRRLRFLEAPSLGLCSSFPTSGHANRPPSAPPTAH